MSIKRESIREILGSAKFDREVNVKGWVRTKRGNNTIAFVAVNDGSIIHHLQVVIDVQKFSENLLKSITTGSCIDVTGKLVKSLGKGQILYRKRDIHLNS
jgi:asparaginyl-tRNA synthetase